MTDDFIDITPPPAFCAACRYVLGADDPATVFGAIRRGGKPIKRVELIHAAILLVQAMGPNAPARDIAQALSRQRDLRKFSAADRKAAHELAVALTASAAGGAP
jgi:hypothetical protein